MQPLDPLCKEDQELDRRLRDLMKAGGTIQTPAPTSPIPPPSARTESYLPAAPPSDRWGGAAVCDRTTPARSAAPLRSPFVGGGGGAERGAVARMRWGVEQRQPISGATPSRIPGPARGSADDPGSL
jgi:hypothetical protein